MESPLLLALVKRANECPRFCVVFRKLNEINFGDFFISNVFKCVQLEDPPGLQDDVSIYSHAVETRARLVVVLDLNINQTNLAFLQSKFDILGISFSVTGRTETSFYRLILTAY